MRRDNGPAAAFKAAAKEFGDNSALPDTEHGMLYGVRSAIAHEFGLENFSVVFTYSQSTTIFKQGPNSSPEVGLRGVWDWVEKLVANLRAEHQKGNVILAPSVTAGKLIRQVFVVLDR